MSGLGLHGLLLISLVLANCLIRGAVFMKVSKYNIVARLMLGFTHYCVGNSGVRIGHPTLPVISEEFCNVHGAEHHRVACCVKHSFPD